MSLKPYDVPARSCGNGLGIWDGQEAGVLGLEGYTHEHCFLAAILEQIQTCCVSFIYLETQKRTQTVGILVRLEVTVHDAIVV